MKKSISVHRVAPLDKRGRPLQVEYLICVGEPTQRGASTRLILRAGQLRRLIAEAKRALNLGGT